MNKRTVVFAVSLSLCSFAGAQTQTKGGGISGHKKTSVDIISSNS